MTEIFKWLEEINKKHPPFNPETWVAPSVRYPEKTVKELWKLINETF